MFVIEIVFCDEIGDEIFAIESQGYKGSTQWYSYEIAHDEHLIGFQETHTESYLTGLGFLKWKI